jgi:hypothetical protein
MLAWGVDVSHNGHMVRTLYGDRKEKVRAILLQLARGGRTIFYAELGLLVGIPTAGPWKPVLDEISREETTKGLPDITYLVISRKSGLPGQIGFKEAKPPSPAQRQQAATVTEAVFAHYRAKKSRS